MGEVQLKIKRFDDVLSIVRRMYPTLRFDVTTIDAEYPYVSADIPQQDGLDFDVSVMLEPNEISLSAEGFHCGWYGACEEQDGFDSLVDALLGVIAGRYRVRQVIRYGILAKAQLRCPDGEGWRVIGTTRIWPRGLLPFGRTERVVWNTSGKPPTESYVWRDDLHQSPLGYIWFLPLRPEREPDATE